jgi:GNAT superfamily N-acetyltransferase
MNSSNTAVVIKEVTTATDKTHFVSLPYKLNKKEKFWVPPLYLSQKELLSQKNPFWRKNPHRFFIACRGNICVGRIAAFIDRSHAVYFGRHDGFFGFLDAIDDSDIFSLLLTAAEEFLIASNCQSITGPMNPTIHHELGVLTEGFELPPYFMLTYNQYYYDKHIQTCGYQKLKDFSAYTLNTDEFLLTDKMVRIKRLLQDKYSIRLRTPNLRDFKNELRIFHEIYNNAFIHHWGFSPIGWEDFQFLGKDMKMVLDKEMVLIAEMNHKPVGFLLAIPNLNEVLAKLNNGRLFPFGFLKLLFRKRKIKSLRVITVAIKKEYQYLGIGSILYPEIAQRAKINGYQSAELSWVVDGNVQMNKICNEVGAKSYKNYRIYNKGLILDLP